jgi:hypothetical protein
MNLRRIGHPARRVLVTDGRAAFPATDAQHIDVRGNDHKLWAETMPAGR